MSLTLSGVSAMTRKMKQVADEAISRARESLHDEGERVMAESQEAVPVDTGHLKSTGKVSDVIVEGNNISVILSYDADYSAVVHESDTSDGRKFLERKMRDSVFGFASRLAQRLRIK
jgi:hypothetical protein